MMNFSEAKEALRRHATPSNKEILQRFFKTGPGQYGEGDIFIGVKVPHIRGVARNYQKLPTSQTLKLLRSPVHEERLLALLILIHQFNKGDADTKGAIATLYLEHTRYTNNWDLIDVSAPNIIGKWLKDKDRTTLHALARSKNIWERRIAIIATLAFIRNGEVSETFRIADILLKDPEDLIRKATGWMLREAGKRDIQALRNFLKTRHAVMPRTMLRYAIERFPEEERQIYMKKRALCRSAA